jgi:hypothetical protein
MTKGDAAHLRAEQPGLVGNGKEFRVIGLDWFTTLIRTLSGCWTPTASASFTSTSDSARPLANASVSWA